MQRRSQRRWSQALNFGNCEEIEGFVVVVGPFLGMFGGQQLADSLVVLVPLVGAAVTLALGFGAGLYLLHGLQLFDSDDVSQ